MRSQHSATQGNIASRFEECVGRCERDLEDLASVGIVLEGWYRQ